jgi:hypothetical protein
MKEKNKKMCQIDKIKKTINMLNAVHDADKNPIWHKVPLYCCSGNNNHINNF